MHKECARLQNQPIRIYVCAFCLETEKKTRHRDSILVHTKGCSVLLKNNLRSAGSSNTLENSMNRSNVVSMASTEIPGHASVVKRRSLRVSIPKSELNCNEQSSISDVGAYSRNISPCSHVGKLDCLKQNNATYSGNAANSSQNNGIQQKGLYIRLSRPMFRANSDHGRSSISNEVLHSGIRQSVSQLDLCSSSVSSARAIRQKSSEATHNSVDDISFDSDLVEPTTAVPNLKPGGSKDPELDSLFQEATLALSASSDLHGTIRAPVFDTPSSPGCKPGTNMNEDSKARLKSEEIAKRKVQGEESSLHYMNLKTNRTKCEIFSFSAKRKEPQTSSFLLESFDVRCGLYTYLSQVLSEK